MIEIRLDGVRVSKVWARNILSRVLRLEKAPRRSVSVLITTNRQIRLLNKQFLKHDYATDVISFWQEKGRVVPGEKDYLGDLVVSSEMAKQVSGKLGIAYKEELARYLVHGALHLLGYEDEFPARKKKMHARQEFILRKILK